MAIDPSVRERVSLAGLVRSARAARRRADLGASIALVPAHNEEDQIEAAIRSLQEQESPPDLIIVCADNCTDRTAPRAEAAGAHVFETVETVHRKAGALDQALDILLPELHDEDAVLVMDADSALAPRFLAQVDASGSSGMRRPAATLVGGVRLPHAATMEAFAVFIASRPVVLASSC